MSRNLLKKKKQRKDYERRRNITKAEKIQIKKGKRKGYSLDFPKSQKLRQYIKDIIK